MTDEVKARLFEAFFTTKPKGKGTGLGLATCQTIVQQSGGHIGVYSEVGKGTTFKIYFPRVEQPLDVAARPIQTGPLPRGTETLLVVEDEPSVRHLARGVLETQGYEVLSASNGQDALHVAREHKGSPIRLVVTDVIMPLMGGKVMAEWLKTTYPDLKILFTSGYTDDAIAHHGVLETGVEFLSKPYTPATLARKVREMLDTAGEGMVIAHPKKSPRGMVSPFAFSFPGSPSAVVLVFGAFPCLADYFFGGGSRWENFPRAVSANGRNPRRHRPSGRGVDHVRAHGGGNGRFAVGRALSSFRTAIRCRDQGNNKNWSRPLQHQSRDQDGCGEHQAGGNGKPRLCFGSRRPQGGGADGIVQSRI